MLCPVRFHEEDLLLRRQFKIEPTGTSVTEPESALGATIVSGMEHAESLCGAALPLTVLIRVDVLALYADRITNRRQVFEQCAYTTALRFSLK